MERVEKKLQNILTQVTQTVGVDRVASLLGGAMVGAARTKATIDRNIDTLMAMANLPSRGDYQRLQRKLDSLQGSIMNLTRAVEELRGTVGNGRASATKATASKPKKAASKTGGTMRRSTSANGRTRSRGTAPKKRG